MRWVVAAAVVLGGFGPAGAQFYPGPGWGGRYYTRGNFNVSFGGPNFAVRGFTAQVFAFPAPRPLAGGPFGWSPVPGGDPFAWAPPPVVVMPPPVVFAANPLAPANPGFDVRVEPEPALPRADERDFIAIRPGQRPPNLAAALPAPVPPKVFAPPIPAGPPLDLVGDKKDNPRAESARQVGLAKAAFAAGDYGRAAERLAAAIRAKPDEPLPHFLLAQARFSRGEYAEAVAAVRDGMKLAPDWPAAVFRPRELYGADPDRHDAYLRELRAVLAANPADPTLGFLLGYQLWFTGHRDEAVKHFRRVTGRVKDNAIVERFLREVDAKVAGR
jgi:hypothetical protein